MEFSAIRDIQLEELKGKKIFFYTRKTKSGNAYRGRVIEIKYGHNQTNVLIESAGRKINLGGGTKVALG